MTPVTLAREASLEDCIFCSIAAGRAAASIVYEDERVIAFLDITPVTPGHILVIPREHHVGLADTPPELAADLMLTAQRLSGRLRESGLRESGLRCEGVNLFLADGEPAGQEVFHMHLHLFPRFGGDGFALKARWKTVDRAELDRIAGMLAGGGKENGGWPVSLCTHW